MAEPFTKIGERLYRTMASEAELVGIFNDAARYRALRDRKRLQRKRVTGLQVVDYESRDEGKLLYGDELDAVLDRERHHG